MKAREFVADPVRGRGTLRALAASNGAGKITAKQIKTEELCVDDICVTREKFKQVFGEGNQSLIIDNSPTPEATSETTPESIPFSTPETIPAPTPEPTPSPEAEI